MTRFRAMALAALLAAGLAACSTSIGKIVANPRDYEGKTVTVSGTVAERFSLVVVKFFVLRDGTGEIRVITQRPLPVQGTKLTVRGKVREAFSLGDAQVLVLEEEPGK